MKRSDILKLMGKYINNKIQLRDNHQGSLIHAGNILNELELVGMLPPNKSGFVKYNPTDGLQAINSFRETHNWESEE